MRILTIILMFFCSISYGQIRDFQIKGGTSIDSFYVMCTDTADLSTKKGLGKWFTARDFISLVGGGGGGGATNLTIGGSGPTYTIESSTGTDVTIAAAGIVTLSEGTPNILTITATEVDGSTSNEIQDITLSGTTTVTFDLSSDATDATITGAGIAAISRSGNAITVTATEVDGSTTNEAWTADADDADTELITNQTLKFEGGVGILTDYVSGSPDKVTFAIDGDEFTDVTTPEADDWVLMHDENGAGADVLQKILWSDLASLVGGADGDGIYDGDGTTPTDTDVSVTDSLEFNGTLKIVNNSDDFVGIGAQAPAATLHVRNVSGGTSTEMIIESVSEKVDMDTRAISDGVQSPFTFRFLNKDSHIDMSGDYYQMANITVSKNSATLPGGAINFNVGYDSTGLDNVFVIRSRETGATDGLINVAGGLRYKWATSASSSVTMNTGDYGLSMTTTGAKTATIPDAITGIIGQELMIFNSATSGDITITITGGSGDTIYGDPILNINESAKVICVASNKWIVNN